MRDEITDQLLTVPLTAQIVNSTGALEQTAYTHRYYIGEIITPSNNARLITVSANTTYTFPRRLLLSSALPFPDDELNLTVYLLRDGLGTQNTVVLRDSRFGTVIPGASLLFYYANRSIDYGQTDSTGTFSAYLDPLRAYDLTVSALNYVSKDTQIFGLSGGQTLYLDLLRFDANLTPSLAFSPVGTGLSTVTPAYLFVAVTNWQQLANLTVVVATNSQLLRLWEVSGANLSGQVTAYTFNLTDATNWCTASLLCVGSNVTLKWRVMGAMLNTYGGEVAVSAVGYDLRGKKYVWNKGDFYTTAQGAGSIRAFVYQLSTEQRYFAGFILLLMATTAISFRFRLSTEQAGYLLGFLILPLVYFGFFSRGLVILPLLILVYLLANKEARSS